MAIFAFDDFNSYTNLTIDLNWPGAGLLQTGTNYGLAALAPPDGSQYIHQIGLFQTSLNDPWGTVQYLKTRTYTGLDPLTPYEVRFKMCIGLSSDGGVGAFPGKHQMTAGMTVGGVHLYLSVVVPVGPLGATYVNDVPSDATSSVFTITPWRPPEYVQSIFAGLAGWKDYSLLPTTDALGHLTITMGTFDAQNFGAAVSMDSFEIHTIPVAGRPRSKVRPQVFGVGR